jgi:tetratricopeptide (TPR) repeat protein
VPSGTESISDLAQDFAACRNDRIGVTRRRAIRLILGRLDSRRASFAVLELRARLWRELAREARSPQELSQAWNETLSSLDALVSFPSLTDTQKDAAYGMLVEWSIDFSQTSGSHVGINKMLAQLHRSISYLGQQLGPSRDQDDENAQYVGFLLCLRAKARRAIASLLRRRGQGGKNTKWKIETYKNQALHDAKRGHALLESEFSQLELALCLFANSATPSNQNAKLAMELLTASVESGAGPLTRYELVKQYRLRYEFAEAIAVFKDVVSLESNFRRFHSNVTHFAASVIGLYYEGDKTDTVKQYALLALPWIEEIISYDRHSARDLVDMCYLKAISGWSIEDCVAPVNRLKAVSVSLWNELADMAKQVADGDLGHAILIGLEDPVIWSRIGSFYAEFAKDYPRAIEFYERATLIAPLSPVFHFNKAEALAYGIGDYQSAKLSFEYAMSLKDRSYAWYKSIQSKVGRLETEIGKNVGRGQEGTGHD